MRDWNVVATTRDGGFRRACEFLSLEGIVSRTKFYNVLVMKVSDLDAFLAWLSRQWSASHHFAEVIAHVRPARATFSFQSKEEFEASARELALEAAPRLEGKSFHVRVHFRGFEGHPSKDQEERYLADALLSHLSASGSPGRITFDDPDFILSVDTIGDRAGMTLWSREELRQYPFLGLD